MKPLVWLKSTDRGLKSRCSHCFTGSNSYLVVNSFKKAVEDRFPNYANVMRVSESDRNELSYESMVSI